MNPYFNDPHGIGTREDPHAQARKARDQPLLLHSLSLFREVFAEVFAQREISTVVEIGVESGRVSGMYAELGASAVHCVEPQPTDELRANLDGAELHLVEGTSPAVLDEIPVGDLYVIDGDHNYATLGKELDWILTHAPDAVVVFHDLLWPCSRRDQYYQPSGLTAEETHPAGEDGPTVWHDDTTPAGFVGRGAFTAAREAGGERNGTLTAVEDALDRHADDPWELTVVPAVFGLGVMARRSSPGAAALLEALRPYSTSTLLEAMENNRIALYTRVLQMQYEAVAHADAADRLAMAVSAQNAELDGLRNELDEAHARYDEQVHRSLEEKRALELEIAELRERSPARVLKDVLRTVLLWPRRKWNSYEGRG
ncbi:hypothetical protein FHX42_000125 [Saccharopolyspora lacisalsi]|uniref:Uncharacterized protein n=1 Tax=Halosaccharopolyspora lacisalsi TaxID=1000566 RepID=A0A839DR84_9PSEU|nr:class I SAM-dependent methyltransferase [Halosaccharopolyspora lacisalsi]MBA8822796.1 hypothetical protein [Halosaccharopolyspora lacisalsi]